MAYNAPLKGRNDEPATRFATWSRAVTPGDDDLPAHRMIRIGGAGDLEVEYGDGTTDTIVGCLAGEKLALSVRKITAGTTASDITIFR
jgi:hypothetical protein